jgi:hypothetical protein
MGKAMNAEAETMSAGGEQPSRTPVKVGWLFQKDAGTVLLFDPEQVDPDPPERMKSAEMNRKHAKSASRCPAIINLESRHFVVRCPYDIHLRIVRDNKGAAALQSVAGDASPVRLKHLSSLVTLVPQKEWRYPAKPTVQVMTPYVFIADEPVFLNQYPPFFHYLQHPWPGTLFGGRFPIHVWPRPLMWAFEWHDLSKDLVLRRGDPWFYVNFEAAPPDRPVQLVEVQRTPELATYMESISGVTNYVNQTFSLFREAGKRRPKVLLKPVDRER